jgi:undecaprenyl-diphosphatase
VDTRTLRITDGHQGLTSGAVAFEWLIRQARLWRLAFVQKWPGPWLVGCYAALLFTLALLSTLAASFDRLPLDLELTRAVQSVDSPELRAAMRFSTNMTSPTFSLFALAIVASGLLTLGRPRLALFAFGGLASHALGGAIKVLVNRPRPDPDLVETVRFEQHFSYPSGHVEWVVGFEGFCVFAIFQLTRNWWTRTAAVALWLCHLVLTGAGRVDQGLHWPSDILGSVLVVSIALAFVIWLYLVSLRRDRIATTGPAGSNRWRQDQGRPRSTNPTGQAFGR